VGRSIIKLMEPTTMKDLHLIARCVWRQSDVALLTRLSGVTNLAVQIHSGVLNYSIFFADLGLSKFIKVPISI
jgi:hypothetical protein